MAIIHKNKKIIKENCCLKDRSFSTISQDNSGPSFSPFSHDTRALSITQLFITRGVVPPPLLFFYESKALIFMIYKNLFLEDFLQKKLKASIRDYHPLWFLFPKKFYFHIYKNIKYKIFYIEF